MEKSLSASAENIKRAYPKNGNQTQSAKYISSIQDSIT